MPHPTDEFSSIEPIQKPTKFNGKEVLIKPLTVGQIPKFARALQGGLLGAVTRLSTDPNQAEGLVELVAHHGEALISAVSIASGVPVAEIEPADMDDLVQLVLAVVQVNSDFFVQRLNPLLAGAMQAVNGAGQTR